MSSRTIATGMKTGIYLLFIALLLFLLIVDAPWEDPSAATGGSVDAPGLIAPTQERLFHDTNVTLEWEVLEYRYAARISTNGTLQNSSLAPLRTEAEVGFFDVLGLGHGTHEYTILGYDSAGHERLMKDEALWLGSPEHEAVINVSDGSVITPAHPAWAPLYWKAQPNATYEVTINTLPYQLTEVNITIDHGLGYARVKNLEPGKRYSYQVDQIDPVPESSDPILGDVAIFLTTEAPFLEFQLRHYSYTVELAAEDDANFAAPLGVFTGLEATTLDLSEMTEDLPELGQGYRWRVRASDGVDHTTGWSAVGLFRSGTTNHLGQELLENWGATVLILGGVMLATMVGGVYLAKDEDQELILPEYSAEEVLTAKVPEGLPPSRDQEVGR